MVIQAENQGQADWSLSASGEVSILPERSWEPAVPLDRCPSTSELRTWHSVPSGWGRTTAARMMGKKGKSLQPRLPLTESVNKGQP